MMRIGWNYQFCFKRNLSTKKERDREHLIDIGKKIGIKDYEDWYNIDSKQLSSHGGSSLLDRYSKSLYNLMSFLLPEHKWSPWRFKQNVPFGWWGQKKNQILYMDWLGKQLGFKTKEDWHQISAKDFFDNRSGGLLVRFRGSPFKVVQSVYNEHHWNPIHFKNLKHWDIENSKTFMEDLAKKLGFKEKDDWYKVTRTDIINYGGGGLLAKHNQSPFKLIRSVYPETDWNFRDRVTKKRTKEIKQFYNWVHKNKEDS